jgi:hypothetical protein
MADGEIARRLWLFIDNEHKAGYSSIGRVRIYENTQRPVNYFNSPDDIVQCALLTKVLNLANNHRVARFAEINGL